MDNVLNVASFFLIECVEFWGKKINSSMISSKFMMLSSAEESTHIKPAHTPGGVWWRPRGGVDPVHKERRGQTGHIQHRGGPQQPLHSCVLAPRARHYRHRPPAAGAKLREPDGRVSTQPSTTAQQHAYG